MNNKNFVYKNGFLNADIMYNKYCLMPPKFVFIVPYRDRESYLNLFLHYMPYILEDYNENDYEIFIAHQKDDKPFNRGAIKNLGFLYVKRKYPNDYKNITLVFNDIDTIPGKKNLLPYETKQGMVKHFFGFKYALGGIVAINGGDFERINGFPNYWGWGFEDNCLQKRCNAHNISINRDVFFPFGDKDILQFFTGMKRTLDNEVVHKLNRDNGSNGWNNISNITFSERSLKPNYYMIDVTSWSIPEKHTDIVFETRTQLTRVSQPKYQMGNIMMMSNRRR